MSKQSGLGDRLFVGGYDLSGDIGSLETISGSFATQEVPGINVSAQERIGLHRDGRIVFNAWFNKAAGRAHPVLSALPTGDVVVTYLRGTTLGNAGAALVAKQANYDGERAADGSFVLTSELLANGYGLQWGDQLTAGERTDTGATDGTSVDGGAATTFGAQAFLQVTAFIGTDVTIKIQDSADNAAWADLTAGAFTAVTAAPDSERIATAAGATVRRYLRIATTTSGGFSSATFSVIVVRNATAIVF